MKTIEFTVVYPVTFRVNVNDNYENLQPDELEFLRSDILNKADELFGNSSTPIIQSAHEVVGEGVDPDNLNFFTEL